MGPNGRPQHSVALGAGPAACPGDRFGRSIAVAVAAVAWGRWPDAGPPLPSHRVRGCVRPICAGGGIPMVRLPTPPTLRAAALPRFRALLSRPCVWMHGMGCWTRSATTETLRSWGQQSGSGMQGNEVGSRCTQGRVEADGHVCPRRSQEVTGLALQVGRSALSHAVAIQLSLDGGPVRGGDKPCCLVSGV